MALVLLAAGVASLLGFVRTRPLRAEWLLCSVVLMGVGAMQYQDGLNAPHLPDFAQPRPDASTASTTTGGGLSYKNLHWLEQDGKRYIAGTITNNYTGKWNDVFAEFEVFDAAGNSLGVINQPFHNLEPKQELELRLELPYPEANRFKFLRFSF